MSNTPDKMTPPTSSNNSLDSFQHKQALGADEIRILTLRPGSKDDEIRYQVAIEDREAAANTYDAISYCWGDPNDLTIVISSNANSFITVSLANALRAFRHPETPCRLWADSVCINQENEEEKGHQVKAMGKIYENAKRVLVWLGHDEDGLAKDCFSLIRETNHYMDEQFEEFGSWTEIPRLRKPWPICGDLSRWAKVRDLLELPWFTRVWVVQEVGLAKHGLLQWGEDQLDIAQLVEVGLWAASRKDFRTITGYTGLGEVAGVFINIQSTYSNVETWRKSMPCIRLMTKLRRRYQSPLFLDILEISRQKLATDCRDHIYAFLGHPLAQKVNGELMVEPEYDKEVDSVYLNLTCALLEHPREAPFVLSHVQYRSKQHFERRCGPSWVPRWEKGWSQTAMGDHPDFKAGGIDGQFQVEFTNKDGNPNFLNCKGFLFDHITWTSSPIEQWNLSANYNVWDMETKQYNEPLVDILRRNAFEEIPYFEDQLEKREDAFSLTLVSHYALKDIDMAGHRLDYAAYLRAVRIAVNSNRGKTTADITQPDIGGDVYFFQGACETAHDRRFACTKDGRFGLVPMCAQINDGCFILPGVSVPFILRPVGEGHYHLIGDCYVHGVMAGEMMAELTSGKFQEQTLTLA